MCSVERHYVKDTQLSAQSEGAWVLNYITSTEGKKITHTPSQNLKKDPCWKVNRKVSVLYLGSQHSLETLRGEFCL